MCDVNSLRAMLDTQQNVPAETAPRIETETLILRPHHLDDLPGMYSMWSDPKIVEYISSAPSTFGETWLRMLQYSGHWQHMGFGYWAIERRSDNRYIGEVGFANFRRGLSPKLEDVPEAGWCVARPYQGMGYASEAVKLALLWAECVWKMKESVCLINPKNRVSVYLANKLGFNFVEQIASAEKELLLFSRKNS